MWIKVKQDEALTQSLAEEPERTLGIWTSLGIVATTRHGQKIIYTKIQEIAAEKMEWWREDAPFSGFK